MQRTIPTLALLAVSSAAGCSAPVTQLARAPRPAESRRDPSARGELEALTMAHFSVRGGEGAGASILEGSAVLGRGSVRVDVDEPQVTRELELFGREIERGVLVVEAKLTERGSDGRSLKWSPTVRVARGEERIVSVAGAGWARSLVVRLDASPPAANSQASTARASSPPPS